MFFFLSHVILDLIQTFAGEIQNSIFTLKMHQEMFFFHTLQDNENADRFEFVFEETLTEKSHDYFDVIVFEKPHFQKVLRPHSNKKPVFSNSSCLKSI